MSRFWQSICAAVAVAFLMLWLLPRPDSYHYRPSVGTQIVGFTALNLLVAVVWAVCFRKQVERLQVGVPCILALVAMEAVMFLAARVLNSTLQ